MLFAIEPRTTVGKKLICFRVWTCINTIALSAISCKEAFVASPIGPSLRAESTNLFVQPVTHELFFLRKNVLAESSDVLIYPSAFEASAVGPHIHSEAVSFAFHKVASEPISMFPLLNGNPMHDVTTPESMDSETILMDFQTASMLHVIDPVAVINFSLRMGKFAIAICPTQVPVAFVPGSITENYFSLSVSEASKPLALINVAAVLVCVLVELQVLLKLNLVFTSKKSGLNHS